MDIIVGLPTVLLWQLTPIFQLTRSITMDRGIYVRRESEEEKRLVLGRADIEFIPA